MTKLMPICASSRKCAAAGALVLLVAGGCISHNVSFSLATLPTGDSIHIHEVWRNMGVQQRAVVLHPRNGDAQTLVVSADERSDREVSAEGFDVQLDGNQITVWRIAGGGQKALATVTVGNDDSAVLAAPQETIPYLGTRLGCRIQRTLSTAEVGEAESVSLSILSARDIGSDANKDSYWLA